MMNKRLTWALLILYTLPWGLQCLVNNFMSVYVASLPFTTEQTVGSIMAFGSAVTILSQLVWAKIAYRSKNRFNVLALSFLLIVLFSIPFICLNMNLPMLCVAVFLFYFCFMVHQPLIDSISSENANKLIYPFGAVRSFASFGFALAGLVLGVVGFKSAKDIFYYVAIIAGISAIISMTAPKETPHRHSEKKRFNFTKIFNKQYVYFLIYTFLLYMTSAVNVVFFPVYYTDVLKGNLGLLSIVISVEAFLEWGIMMVFGSKIAKTHPRKIFMIIAFSAAFRSFAVWFFQNPYLVLLTFAGSAIWFGLQWASVAPYICQIVPKDSNVTAQSVWTLASSGLGTTIGSLIGGVIAQVSSIRTLFLISTLLMLLLAGLSPVLFPKTKQNNEYESTL